MTIFAVLAGCVGAELTGVQILIIGFGNLIGDAVSMGFGEYISEKSESDFYECEKAREQWEVTYNPEGEKREMIEIYTGRYGFTTEDAVTFTEIAFKYPEFFLSHMMKEELGLGMADCVDGLDLSPFTKGLAMFGAFMVFGSVPLLSYGLFRWLGSSVHAHWAFAFTAVSCALTLFALGVMKAQFVCQSAWQSGLIMMSNGVIAGGLTFGIGTLLQQQAK
ncbi:MAG: uncharacterized protein KVP18_000325 [Porospora cf. gigantea A]|uniref:uncharacterized protein n=1 Tax=Porospora cf. gigantea A TaxID=2853593 RepID=UPI003559620A|nr:MAG: hypothetical protein KVP18_000325 [Porospora cf. gigantea A]